MQLLVADFSAVKGHGRRAPAAKRRRDVLHTLEVSKDKRDCSQCRPKLARGQHGRQTHYRCADCNTFLCMPDCYNKHVQQLAHTENIIE